MIKLNSKIYVAGHTGLVGSAILRKLKQKGYKNVFTISRKKLDLKDQNKVFRYLKKSNQILYLLLQQKLEVFIQIVILKQILFMIIYRFS